MSGDVTYQALSRLSYLPNRTSLDNGEVIAGQSYADVYFTGGTISNVTITGASIVLDSINNTPIGNTTPSTGAFTNLTASGNFTVGGTKFNVTGSSGNIATLGTLHVASMSSSGVVHNDSTGLFSSSLIVNADITANTITYSKLQNETSSTLLGNPTGSGAVPSEITLGSALAFSGTALQTVAMTGDITTSTNSFATTIGANKVTYAKFQQVAASSLVGNPTGTLANAQSITLGTTLSFSGTTLQTTAHTGDVTSVANSNALTVAKIAGVSVGTPTGTTNIVFSNSPTLVTPTLGVATATSLSFSSTNGIIGTTTNNNAATGSVGEYLSSTILRASALTMNSATATNITSLSLTAGDWDVFYSAKFVPANSIILGLAYANLNTITATISLDEISLSAWLGNFSGDGTSTLSLGGTNRISLATTTTIFLVVQDSATGTAGVYGTIWARRIR